MVDTIFERTEDLKKPAIVCYVIDFIKLYKNDFTTSSLDFVLNLLSDLFLYRRGKIEIVLFLFGILKMTFTSKEDIETFNNWILKCPKRLKALLMKKGYIEQKINKNHLVQPWDIKSKETTVASDGIVRSIIEDNVDEMKKYIKYNKNYVFPIDDYSFLQTTLTSFAAYHGSVNCFKFLIVNNFPLSKDVTKCAIAGGNVEIIHVLEDKGYNFSNLLDIAVK